jgi:hypothetical protein
MSKKACSSAGGTNTPVALNGVVRILSLIPAGKACLTVWCGGGPECRISPGNPLTFGKKLIFHHITDDTKCFWPLSTKNHTKQAPGALFSSELERQRRAPFAWRSGSDGAQALSADVSMVIWSRTPKTTAQGG